MNMATRAHLGLLSAVALVLLLALIHSALRDPPDPVPSNAPSGQFSADRAAALLEKILDGDEPHPTGSAANRAVKQRIGHELEALGIPVGEQQTLGCSREHASCAWVENLYGLVRGSSEQLILVMSHYDSVPPSPGAGDDGAAVAAMLESARLLLTTGAHRNGVLFLFTDGEELGLLGAEAFFAHHPLAERVAVVINLEGSGSDGPSMLLRTGPRSDWLVQRYLNQVRFPAGVSSTNEIFKWLPNDTDFSVAAAHDLPGLDFAFAGERHHYHTPMDNLDNLSRATLQHHGENLAPLMVALADADLGGSGDELAYYTLYHRLKIAWSESLTPIIAALVLLLTAGLCRLMVARGRCSMRELYFSLAATGALLVAIPLINGLVYATLSRLHGTIPDWPAHPAPLQLAIGGATLATGVAVITFSRRYCSAESSFAALLLTWAALACLLAWLLPAAANTLIIPSLLMLIPAALFCTRVARGNSGRWLLYLVALAIVTPFTIGVIIETEPTLGYRLWPIGFPFYALIMLAAAPILLRYLESHSNTWLLALGSVATLAGLGLWQMLPLYSEERPQQINLRHLQDHDNQTAYWVAASPDPLPEAVAGKFALDEEITPLLPWLTMSPGPGTPAPVTGQLPPVLELLAEEQLPDGRQVHLHIRSQRGAGQVILLLPPSAEVHELQLENIALPARVIPRAARVAGEHYFVRASAIPPEGFELRITFGSSAPVVIYFMDVTADMPAGASELSSARNRLAVPVHQGDQTLIFRRATI